MLVLHGCFGVFFLFLLNRKLFSFRFISVLFQLCGQLNERRYLWMRTQSGRRSWKARRTFWSRRTPTSPSSVRRPAIRSRPSSGRRSTDRCRKEGQYVRYFVEGHGKLHYRSGIIFRHKHLPRPQLVTFAEASAKLTVYCAYCQFRLNLRERDTGVVRLSQQLLDVELVIQPFQTFLFRAQCEFPFNCAPLIYMVTYIHSSRTEIYPDIIAGSAFITDIYC